MGRDYDPVAGQWYENLEQEEVFRVLNVDEDSELIEVQYEDGEVEEIDLEAWTEMDLELTDKPEGWVASDNDEDEDEEEEDDEEYDEDEDDDWEDDEDEDDDEDDDDWEDGDGDRDSY